MRVVVDCREIPSESRCSLSIAGEEDEVLRAAALHAVDVHGHADNQELRDGIRAGLRPESAGRIDGYGTTMIGKAKPGAVAGMMEAVRDWETQRRVPGFLGAQIQVADDGETIVNTAIFADRAAYQRLADDPEQDRWWRTRMAPLLDGEPQWTDGDWMVYYRQPAIVLPNQTAPETGAAART